MGVESGGKDMGEGDVKVWLKFPIEVPDGTAPQRVLEVANSALDDDDGRLCQWGEWSPGPAELATASDDFERRLSAVEDRLQIGPLKRGETRYGGGGNSVHLHVAHGPCTCGEVIP